MWFYTRNRLSAAQRPQVKGGSSAFEAPSATRRAWAKSGRNVSTRAMMDALRVRASASIALRLTTPTISWLPREITVVMIEHDMRLVDLVSDRVMALDRGAVVATGAPQQIMVDPRVVETYLGE